MTAKEMQRRSAKARWSGKTAEARRREMSAPACARRANDGPKRGLALSRSPNETIKNNTDKIMKSHLYFSMQRHNESQDAWLRRTAPAYEHRNRSAGLSGRPNLQGIRVLDFDHTLANGEKVKAVRVGYGWRASCAVEDFAKANGLGFERFNGNGCSGMCKRQDGVAYEASQCAEVYDNDNH